MVWILSPPHPPIIPPPHFETPTADVSELEDKAFRGITKVKGGHKGGPQSSRTDVLRKGRDTRTETHRRKAIWGHREKVSICRSGRVFPETHSASTLYLTFQPLELQENTLLLFSLCYLACGTLLWQSLSRLTHLHCRSLSCHSFISLPKWSPTFPEDAFS